MDILELNTWVCIIGIIVGIIGIVVGIIGKKSLSKISAIENDIRADTVQQTQVLNIGMDEYAVIRLTRDTTKEELERLLSELQLARVKTELNGNDENIITIY